MRQPNEVTWTSCDHHAVVDARGMEELVAHSIQALDAEWNPYKGEAVISTGDTVMLTKRLENGTIELRDCKLRRRGIIETKERIIERLERELVELKAASEK